MRTVANLVLDGSLDVSRLDLLDALGWICLEHLIKQYRIASDSKRSPLYDFAGRRGHELTA